MTDHPILFSAPMIRALLEGRKTQTRRVTQTKRTALHTSFELEALYEAGWNVTDSEDCYGDHLFKLSHRPGDRLWVREAWRVGAWHWNNSTVALDYCDGPRKEWLDVEDGDLLHRLIKQSRADAAKAGTKLREQSYYEYSWSPGSSPCRWRPSIHMPRWASRLTLTVTDVRVQRLQDISEADAIAEGVKQKPTPDRGHHRRWADYSGVADHFFDARNSFRTLWNSINGPDAWDANPWVTATSFEVHKCNIDQMEQTND